MKKKPTPTPLPSKQAILDFLADSSNRAGKREIGRAFGIKGGAAKIALKKILKEMAEEGLIDRKNRKQMSPKGQLPPVTVLDITGTDIDGELLGKPATIDVDPAPHILIVPSKTTGQMPPGVGEQVLARLTKTGENEYEAKVIRRISRNQETILGIYQKTKGSGRLVPVDKRSRHEFTVHEKNAGEAKNGDLVLAERLTDDGGRRGGLRAARIREVLGPRMGDPRTISLIAIHEHGIPVDFPADALRQAQDAKPTKLGKRTDLRDVPLITIDPADARDHDDAIWAAPDDDPSNPGGWQVIVAIADVAHYVTPGSPLDSAAQDRGNSSYFPDRVVPMLPEELSTDLCSLKEGEERACMAVRMIFEANGKKRRHEFMRGLMRSAASLAYEDAQSAFDGTPTDKAEPMVKPVLAPLYEAYKCVTKARERRAPLDLDLPEHKIRLNDEGKVASVKVAERFDAHKLVEEFMILANVAAAETLEKQKSPLIYRVHEPPNHEKLVALRDFLATLNLKFAMGQVVKPELFNRILSRVKNTEQEQMVNTVVLRSQSQAVYSPVNLGHFGLNLARYAHFTSPIRRYADLIVHRALIKSLSLGSDGLTAEDEAGLTQMAEHISNTERRSMAAERDSTDRYIAAFMAEHVGAEFPGTIASVTRFGLFIRLADTGADGLVPISKLPDDYYVHDEKSHALVGERTSRRFSLGEAVTVRLAEAVPITGGLRFEIIEGGTVDKKRAHRGFATRTPRDKAKGRHKRRRK